MSAVTVPTPRPSLTRSSASRRRHAANILAQVLIVLAFVVTVIPLGLILGYVVVRGMRVMSWSFLTSDIPIVSRAPGGGIGPAVVGTLLITGAAALMAVPLGVLGGIYLHEYGGATTRARIIRFLAEVMTGVPSIVMGLFIYTTWVLAFGVSGFAGALALACLMLPVIIRTTEEMLRLVPLDQRQSAYALGGRRAGTIVRVVLPAAAPGIISGILLAIARAAGETAPLLFTILTVNTVNTDLFAGANTALSVQIFRNAQQVFPGPQERAWGAALTLIGIVVVFTVIARAISAVFSRKHHA
ncbi:MAG: phosphate ABC transporter permease PstA [Actinomycetes bacterium]